MCYKKNAKTAVLVLPLDLLLAFLSDYLQKKHESKLRDYPTNNTYTGKRKTKSVHPPMGVVFRSGRINNYAIGRVAQQ